MQFLVRKRRASESQIAEESAAVKPSVKRRRTVSETRDAGEQVIKKRKIESKSTADDANPLETGEFDEELTKKCDKVEVNDARSSDKQMQSETAANSVSATESVKTKQQRRKEKRAASDSEGGKKNKRLKLNSETTDCEVATSCTLDSSKDISVGEVGDDREKDAVVAGANSAEGQALEKHTKKVKNCDISKCVAVPTEAGSKKKKKKKRNKDKVKTKEIPELRVISK